MNGSMLAEVKRQAIGREVLIKQAAPGGAVTLSSAVIRDGSDGYAFIDSGGEHDMLMRWAEVNRVVQNDCVIMKLVKRTI